MGTWGANSFQNDWASDWTSDLLDSADASLVQTALSRVIEHGGTKQQSPSIFGRLVGRHARTDWLTAANASQALAAAEVVAAWVGHPATDLPDTVKDWTHKHSSSFHPSLLELARQAVNIVKTNSELKILWEEGDATEWKAAVEDLKQRLED